MIDATSNVRAASPKSTLDRWLAEQPATSRPKPPHRLDSPSNKKLHSRLLNWYQQEREIQAANRYQMAIDHDYYDNIQFSNEDEQEINDRGQAAVVFNETAASVDWIIGTEKRTRVDFKVLPRAEDDVKTADAKTKVLKWNSDVNNVVFNRSKAFEDAVKGGIGWLEDGACGDPTQEPLFSRYESWRNIIDDSKSLEIDGSDGRYLFRVKFLDLDVATALVPDRKSKLESAATAENLWGREEDEDLWYLGQHFQSRDAMGQVTGYHSNVSDALMVMNRRQRVKIIEAWYRIPERCQICHGDLFDGERYDPNNDLMKAAVDQGITSLISHVKMQVRCALMTENDLLQDMPSPYKHNRFPFTPIRCYRRGRDGAPYGAIRRWRDVQDDLNKRASKALFILSTNRVIADADAVEDHDEAREEAARPDAYIIKKRGSDFRIESDTELADSHLMMMERDARLIRNIGGVTDDNLGRKTNAVSGEAIKARQLQGSVTTAPVFDNLRFSVKLQGEIQLSLAEQYISMPKAIRLLGARGKIDWLKVNQPEQDAEGNVRYVNDITASKADFVVDEQDFHQSVRQSMFETMGELVGKIATVNPEAALRILKMSLEFSDMPNKDEMAAEIGQILGLPGKDPANMEPEERAQFEQAKKAADQKKAAQEALQMRAAEAEIAEKEARVNKLNADAEAASAKAKEVGLGEDVKLEMQRKIMAIEDAAREELTKMRERITEILQQQADRSKEIESKKDADIRRAEIDADAKVEIAKVNKAGADEIARLEQQLAELKQEIKQAGAEAEKSAKDAKDDKADDVTKAIADIAEQHGESMKAVMETLTALATGQKQLLEAADADQEIDYQLDKDGEIVGVKTGSHDIKFRKNAKGEITGAVKKKRKTDSKA